MIVEHVIVDLALMHGKRVVDVSEQEAQADPRGRLMHCKSGPTAVGIDTARPAPTGGEDRGG